MPFQTLLNDLIRILNHMPQNGILNQMLCNAISNTFIDFFSRYSKMLRFLLLNLGFFLAGCGLKSPSIHAGAERLSHSLSRKSNYLPFAFLHRSIAPNFHGGSTF
jgi:hypothetical protein